MKILFRKHCAIAIVAASVGSGLILSAGPVAAAEDVKMFQTAPSVEELEKALGAGANKPKVKTRSIQFDDGGAAPPPPQQAQPAAAPPPAAYQPPPQQQAAPAPKPAAQQPRHKAAPPSPPPQQQPQQPQQQMAVSEQAVGFPINFDLGSANIRPESVAFLESIAGLMVKDPSIRLLVEGHTDASGNYMKNLDLSRARAYSVMNYLVSRFGIQPQRLQAMGKGPMEPLDASNPYNPSNRRVQFRVIGG
ncbi:OmpA/MotB domain-containing protein [Candidatus Terasakiella magnetica]|nr:OmpA/MotB domain-containing protein [Candidatus Terasakiella magnetica]